MGGLASLGQNLYAQPPAAAIAAGYSTPTFVSYMLPADLDSAQVYPSGKKWYFPNFFGIQPPSASTVTFNGYNMVVGGNNGSVMIQTAGASNGSFVGTAFGGGGYFEVVLAFSSAQVIAANGSGGTSLWGGWPAAWCNSLENWLGATQWVGQAAGYTHAPEVDLMEFATWSNPGYASTIHEFYGISHAGNVSNGVGGGTNYMNAGLPSPGNYSAFHRYGVLWIPATGSTSGSITYYLDGVATASTVSWTQFTTQAPPPGTAPWTFGVTDTQHLVLQISTGTNQPVTVGYVAAWQKDGSGNLTQ